MGMHTLDSALRLNKINEALNQTNNILLELILPKGGINPSSAVRYGQRDPMTGARDFSLQKQRGFINPAGTISGSGLIGGTMPTLRRRVAGTAQSVRKFFDNKPVRSGGPIKDFTQAQRDISLLTGGKSPEELATQAKQFAEYQKTQALAKRQRIMNVVKGGAKLAAGGALAAGLLGMGPLGVPLAGLASLGMQGVGIAPVVGMLGTAALGARGIVSGAKQVGANIGVPRISGINTAEGKRTNFYGKPLVGVPQIDRKEQLRKARVTAARSEALSVNPGQQMTGRQIYANIRNNPSLARRYREDLAYRQNIDRQTSRADYRQDIGFAQSVTPDLLKGQFTAMQKKVNLIKSGERQLRNPIPGVSPERQFLTVGHETHMALGRYADPSNTPETADVYASLGRIYTKSASQMTPTNWEMAAKHSKQLAKGSNAHLPLQQVDTPEAPMVRIPGANKGQSVTQFSHALHPEQLRAAADTNRAAVNAALTAAHGAATDPNSPIAQRAVQSMLSGVRRSGPRPIVRNTTAPTSSVGTA